MSDEKPQRIKPDGFGDFVSDEFTEPEILELRKVLADFDKKYPQTNEKE